MKTNGDTGDLPIFSAKEKNCDCLIRATARRKIKPTALVVGAGKALSKTFTLALRRFGYRTLIASSVKKAQALARLQTKINLLLTDYAVTETSGLDLARWLQGRYPKAKVLITTNCLWELSYNIGEQEQFAVLVEPISDLELDRMLHQLEPRM